MAGSRVRIQDVAERAGVSSATVSLVLSERFITRVSPETAERVRAAVGELGYQAVEKTKELGWLTVVVDAMAPRRLIHEALKGLVQEAWQQEEQAVIVLPLGGGGEAAKASAATLARVPKQRVACVASSGAIDYWKPRLPASTVIVTLDDGAPGGDRGNTHSRVVLDSEPASRTLAGTLAERGHRAVAVLSDGSAVAAGTWTSCLERAGLNVSGLIDVSPTEAGRGESQLRRLLLDPSDSGRTTALVCLSPRALNVARKTVEACGLRVPQDVLVIVHDDGRAETFEHLGVTAAIPAREMGRAAARLLLEDAPGGSVSRRVVARVPRTLSGERRIHRPATQLSITLDQAAEPLR
jgi:LacI family transcriptional regulator